MGGSTRVLLLGANGDWTERAALGRLLEQAGFEVTLEPTPQRPDVVLLELPRSPRLLASLVRQASAVAAPLVVMARDARLPQRARALGAFGYVAHPPALDALCTQLRQAAEARRRHPSLFGLPMGGSRPFR